MMTLYTQGGKLDDVNTRQCSQTWQSQTAES